MTFVEAKVCIGSLVYKNITLGYQIFQRSINVSEFSSQIGLLYPGRPKREDPVYNFFLYRTEVEALNCVINPNVTIERKFSKEIYTQYGNRKD